MLLSLLAGLSILYFGRIRAQVETSYNDQFGEELSRQQRPERNLCKLLEPKDRWTDMSLGFGGYKRHSKGVFKVGMFVEIVKILFAPYSL